MAPEHGLARSKHCRMMVSKHMASPFGVSLLLGLRLEHNVDRAVMVEGVPDYMQWSRALAAEVHMRNASLQYEDGVRVAPSAVLEVAEHALQYMPVFEVSA